MQGGIRVLVVSTVIAAMLGVGTGFALFSLVRPEPDEIYQGLWQEASNRLTGGQYRVMMRCGLHGRRAGHFVRAQTVEEARTRLAWQLPACELTDISEPESDGLLGAWYRGEFVCPANFYRKALALSAGDLDRAQQVAQAYARGCRVEFADQVDCPLIAPKCTKQSVDHRDAQPSSRSALR